MSASDKSFLTYYLHELSSLEDGCAEFAASFPQVAGSLGLGSEGAADPHVRQLIESVAFIAARLKRQIDSVPGELAHGLLHAAAPHLVTSVPSMSVAKFSPISDQLDPKGMVLPGALRLRAASGGESCMFMACTKDVTLWPLSLESCGGRGLGGGSSQSLSGPVSAGCEEFSLKISHVKKKIVTRSPGELTFFISGALNRALAAIDALTLGLVEARMVALDGSWTVHIARDQVQVLGFDPSHRLLPANHSTLHSGALTLESLSFPRRFCFVKVSGLHCPSPTSGFFLNFIVKRPWLAALEAAKEHFHLNCVPIVNLYTKPALAVPLIDGWREYVLPRSDVSNGRWDVFAINRVQLIEHEKRSDIPEFHSGVDSIDPYGGKRIFWQGVRRERLSSNQGHASMALRFIGLEHLQIAHGDDTGVAMVEVSCTNCEAPESLRASQELEVLGWDGGYRARLEFVPTAYVPPLLPTSAATTGILRILQSRSGRADDPCGVVRQYLAAHNRGQTAHAAAVVSALYGIQRSLVAMPRPGMPLGAMIGMGCRYFLSYRKDGELPGSRYLLARLLKHVLLQMHDTSLPLEVISEGVHEETFGVK